MFQLLRDGTPRTRAELAAMTGQARSTVSGRIDALMATGLVAPTGDALASTGGRPPATLAFQPTSKVVLSVDLGATHVHIALTDLASRVLCEYSEQLTIADGPVVVLARVAEIATTLLEQAEIPPDRLVSVGVGLPGPVDHSTGRPTNPPIMPGWDGWDVREHLSSSLGVPVLVDNDVNIMALGEHVSAWPGYRDIIFVKVATGIGAGVISDGNLRRGAQGAAGDIGPIAAPGSQRPCRCGNVGCLEAVASGQALVAALEPRVSSNAELVALVRSGDLPATALVREAGRDIGGVLAGAVSLLNPSLIVIGGIIAEAGEQLLAGIRETVYRRSLPLATEHLRIVTSRTGDAAGILGASAMAIDHVLSAAAIDALVA